MSNIIQEVDDAMRRERMEKLWKDYGHYLLGFVIFVVLATAIHSAWSAWNTSVQSKQTEQLMSLMQDSKFPANISPDKLEMRAPLRGIALLNAAGANAHSGKTAEALKLYESAVSDKSIPADMRHLAILMQARLLAADEASSDKPLEILKPVIDDNGSAWQPYALLEGAALTADRKKDYASARSYLKQVLETKNLPQSLYAKAKSLDELYGVRQEQTQKKDG